MLVVYMAASGGTAAASPLCDHHCHHNHAHHSADCICHGQEFAEPCCEHVHARQADIYIELSTRSDSHNTGMQLMQPAYGTPDDNRQYSIMPPAAARHVYYTVSPPPLLASHACPASLRAPPASI